MIIEKKTKTNPVYKKTYQLWRNMNQRCHNPKNPYYKNYGDKGIYVSDRWRNFSSFVEDVDKINGFNLDDFLAGKLYLDKDFSKKNQYSIESCRFVSIEVSNKMKPHQQKLFIAISPTNETYTSSNQSTFAEEHGLSQSGVADCLRDRLKTHKGWTFKTVK